MYKFIPFEFPQSRDGEFFCFLDDAGVLRSRREQLGLTQQQVADRAGIKFSQYQRLEAGERHLSGCTMRTGLAICAVLMLNPYEMINVSADVPDPSTLKPQTVFDADLSEDLFPKKVGRKQVRRDIMTVYFNHSAYSMIIPREVLVAVGKPSNIEVYWRAEDRRILFRGLDEPTENSYDIPSLLYTEAAALVFPPFQPVTETKAALGWGDEVYAVECRIVKDKSGETHILCDLNTAQESDYVKGPYVTPECFCE